MPASRWKFDPCPVCCNDLECWACVDNAAPDRLQAVLSGCVKDSGIFVGTCAACAALNATYVLDYHSRTVISEPWTTGACHWRYLFDPTVCGAACLWVSVTKAISGFTTYYTWSAKLASVVDYPDPGDVLINWLPHTYHTTPRDCLGLVDEQLDGWPATICTDPGTMLVSAL